MPSELDDSAAETRLVLIARLPEAVAVSDSGALSRLLRCFDGVQIAEVSAGADLAGLEQPLAQYFSRLAGPEPVLVVLLQRHALVAVLSGMLQLGCREFAKMQHLDA